MLLFANILSFIGNILMTSSTIFKKKNVILLFQSANHILAIIAEIIQSAFAGMVQESVSLIRNIILLFIKEDKKITKLVISIILVIIGVVIGIILNIKLNNNIWYGYLPICATVLYTTFILIAYYKTSKAELFIKTGIVINGILWFIYGICIKLYPISIFNAISITVSIIRIVLICNKIDAEHNLSTN